MAARPSNTSCAEQRLIDPMLRGTPQRRIYSRVRNPARETLPDPARLCGAGPGGAVQQPVRFVEGGVMQRVTMFGILFRRTWTILICVLNPALLTMTSSCCPGLYFLLNVFSVRFFLAVFLIVNVLPSLPLHFLPFLVAQRATSFEPLGTFFAMKAKNVVVFLGNFGE